MNEPPTDYAMALDSPRDALARIAELERERSALWEENSLLDKTLRLAWGYIGRTVSEGPERREIRNAIDAALANAQEARE